MASASTEQPQTPFPPQHAVQEAEMQPRPCYIRDTYRGTDKLRGKAAIITGTLAGG